MIVAETGVSLVHGLEIRTLRLTELQGGTVRTTRGDPTMSSHRMQDDETPTLRRRAELHFRTGPRIGCTVASVEVGLISVCNHSGALRLLLLRRGILHEKIAAPTLGFRSIGVEVILQSNTLAPVCPDQALHNAVEHAPANQKIELISQPLTHPTCPNGVFRAQRFRHSLLHRRKDDVREAARSINPLGGATASVGIITLGNFTLLLVEANDILQCSLATSQHTCSARNDLGLAFDIGAKVFL